jgi:nucleoside-diphosphate-sugar epimerase
MTYIMNERSFFIRRSRTMNILVTGAFGNVGRSTVAACLAEGDRITVLEADTRRTRRLAPRLLRAWAALGERPRLILGDVRDPETERRAVAGQDAILHLAALIPPAADRFPELARSVNVGGTARLLAAMRAVAEAGSPPPRLVFASSVAAYGDRIRDYWIRTGDPLDPGAGDGYGRSKVEAESLIRASGLPFVVLRLAAIMWRKKLDPDPLLFSMPLDTRLEICHTEDTGRAFASAARQAGILGSTFDIGGGESCRTDYRSFLDRMFTLIGLGGIRAFPARAFASSGFHCGWFADSDEAEARLTFRGKGLEDYYAEVAEETRLLRPLASMVAPLVRLRMLASSPFLRRLPARAPV